MLGSWGKGMKVRVRVGPIAGLIVIAVVSVGYAIIKISAARSAATSAAINRLETDPRSATRQDLAIYAGLPINERQRVGAEMMLKAMGGKIPGKR